jgi:hypothetical protein
MVRDNEIIESVKVTSSCFTNLGLVIHECSQRTKSDQGTTQVLVTEIALVE